MMNAVKKEAGALEAMKAKLKDMEEWKSKAVPAALLQFVMLFDVRYSLSFLIITHGQQSTTKSKRSWRRSNVSEPSNRKTSNGVSAIQRVKTTTSDWTCSS
jgi:hypothetical protein